jgi:hypothetical protein
MYNIFPQTYTHLHFTLTFLIYRRAPSLIAPLECSSCFHSTSNEVFQECTLSVHIYTPCCFSLMYILLRCRHLSAFATCSCSTTSPLHPSSDQTHSSTGTAIDV